MRESLIAFLAEFQIRMRGGFMPDDRRSEISLGKPGRIVLKFGFGDHDDDRVKVVTYTRSGDEAEVRMLSFTAAAAEFLAAYSIDDCPAHFRPGHATTPAPVGS